jgi:hypothetical protein
LSGRTFSLLFSESGEKRKNFAIMQSYLFYSSEKKSLIFPEVEEEQNRERFEVFISLVY